MLNRLNRSGGFSLPEILIVTALIGIGSGISVSLTGNWLKSARADSAMRQVAYQMTSARELAVTARREIEVQIVGNNTLRIVRHETAPAADTVLRLVPLENGVEFRLFTGIPDTPDLFGRAAAVDFNGADEMTFNAEGSMADSQDVPVNGTIFLGNPTNAQSARAVTVFGGTGRVRAFRWVGSRWEQ